MARYHISIPHPNNVGTFNECRIYGPCTAGNCEHDDVHVFTDDELRARDHRIIHATHAHVCSPDPHCCHIDDGEVATILAAIATAGDG